MYALCSTSCNMCSHGTTGKYTEVKKRPIIIAIGTEEKKKEIFKILT